MTRAAIMFAGATAIAACGEVMPSGVETSSSGASSASSRQESSSFAESSSIESSESSSNFPVLYGPASIPDASFDDAPVSFAMDAGYGAFIDGGVGAPDDAAASDLADGALLAAYGPGPMGH